MKNYVVVDLETTGLSAKTDKIIEIGAIRVRDGNIVDTYGMLVNPRQPIPSRVTELTGITNEMVDGASEMDEAVEGLLAFMGEDVMVGHNVSFDYSFLKQWAVNHKRPLEVRGIDTLKMARSVLPKEQSKTLENLCLYFEIPRENAHRAVDDAVETKVVYDKLTELANLAGLEKRQPVSLVYHAKKQSPVTPHQLERLKEYRMKKGITDEINWETLTKSEASRIMDKYYEKYGR